MLTNYEDNQKTLQVLTIIDLSAEFFEVAHTNDYSSLKASQLFDMHWLCKYPYSHKIIYNEGLEFKYKFLKVLQFYGI